MSIKLTEQEIETIKGFQEKTNAIIADLGRIELQKMDLESAKEQVLGVKSKMAEEQNEFFKSVEESYGKGQINLDTFEFFPTEEKE
jgi:hypothetical protein